MIKSRSPRWACHVDRMEEVWGAFKILTSIPTGTRPLGNPTLILKDNIKMDLKGIGISEMSWVDLARDRDYWRAFVNTTLNLRG